MCPSWGVLLLSLWCGLTLSFSYVGASRFQQSLCRREWSQSGYERYPIADFRPKTINIPVICLHSNLHEANQSWALSHLIEFNKNDTFGKYAVPTLHGKGRGGAGASGYVPLRTSNETEVTDFLCRGVMVESNMTIVMLVVTSSCLLRESNQWPISSGSFTIRSSMDNKTSENMNIRVVKERVLIANVIWVANITAAPKAYIVCDMKLCHDFWLESCPAGCSPPFMFNTPLNVFLEKTVHVPTDATYYSVLVVGIVLGCAAIGVVVVLVKKFFVKAPSPDITTN